VVNELKKLNEHDGFLRGLVAYIGFKQTGVFYHRDERLRGKGNYNRLFGSFRIGFNGVLGFSKYPLHLISILGLIISSLSFLLGVCYLLFKLLQVDIKWGNPTLVILISFLSGIQLLSLGIMGQYFARIYDEVQKRPVFIIDKAVGLNDDEAGGK
jgi:dolichol-phosphate mannosyltransferase